MQGFFFYGVGLLLIVWYSLIGLMLWLAAKTRSKKFVWIISGMGVAVIALLVADALLGCPSAPELSAEDQAALCDGPISPLLQLTVYITAPLALTGQALLTWWMLDKAGRN